MRSPLLFVAGPAPVSIPATDEHQIAQDAGLKYLSSLPQGRVKAMIKAHPDEGARLSRSGKQRVQFHRAARAGFLEKNVLAGRNCSARDLGQPVMARSDDYKIDIGAGDYIAPIR
jgi:hypothetical protein